MSITRKGKAQTVRGMMERWERQQKDLTVFVVPRYWLDFYHEIKAPGKDKFKAYVAKITSQDPTTFQVIPSTINPVRIEDQAGNLLAYRLRIMTKFTEQLAKTEHLIPPIKSSIHKRGETSNRHWAIWTAQTANPIVSSDLVRDKKSSEGNAMQWFEEKPRHVFLPFRSRLAEPRPKDVC